jgi:serine phosphatase RsbU (regulator of sigma subunit)
MLEKNLKSESLRSYKFIYSSFLPIITRYLWDLDVHLINETLFHIIENQYANKIYIYDSDSSPITLIYKDLKTKKTRIKSNDLNEYDYLLSEENKDFLKKMSLIEKDFFIHQENVFKDTSRIIGAIVHKNKKIEKNSIIGYFIIDYSTENIRIAIEKIIQKTIILSILITIIFVFTIGFLVQNTLIKQILRLSQASIDISKGKFYKIKEPLHSKDELFDLIRNFNTMAHQIHTNEENLKLLAKEGIKISSSFNLTQLFNQVKESLINITKTNLNVDFFILGKKNDAYEKTLFKKEKNFVHLNEDFKTPERKKRFYIKDSAESICVIIQIDDLKEVYLFSHSSAEAIYHTIFALQISITNALDNIRFIIDQKEKQKLLDEQETVKIVQNNLMPKSDYRKIGFFELANHFEAADHCAGDWWSYYTLPNNKLLLLLGDVTGHGSASAILTAVVKGYCDSIHIQPYITSQDILEQLDEVVKGSSDGNKVMTMFAAVLDPLNGTIDFSNAAHNFPMIIKRYGKNHPIEKLIATGKPLGFETNGKNYEQKQIKLTSGDILFIFSDGLTESTNNEGEEFGEKRLKKILKNFAEKDVISIKNHLIKEFREFILEKKLSDDITFLVCKFENPQKNNS